MHRRAPILALIVGYTIVLSSACTKPLDLKQALQVTDVSTGWFDAGIVEGTKNKLVPSVTFRLKKIGDKVSSPSLNMIFKIEGAEDGDDVLLQKVEFSSDGTTAPITVRSKFGYTGEQPRAEMLQNSSFRDMTVTIFAKEGSSQWTSLRTEKIARHLLTQ